MSVLDVVHLVTGVMAVAAALLALLRLGLGPSLLDRTVANDVLTAAGIGIIALMIVVWQREDLGVLLVILALTAFISAVVVSRFAVRERSDARRILTPEEAHRQRADREQAAAEADRQEVEEALREAEGEDDGEDDEGSAVEVDPAVPDEEAGQ